jgi:hypothetical protein
MNMNRRGLEAKAKNSAMEPLVGPGLGQNLALGRCRGGRAIGVTELGAQAT